MSDKQPPPDERHLSEEENRRVAEWYQRHGPAVVAEVRKRLRDWTKKKLAVSPSSVAGAVWHSFVAHGIDDVDVTDENGVWAVLAKAARRHCERLNRAANRDRRVSL